MPIGLTDLLSPLGSFPLVEDKDVKGGFRAVANIAARNAIPSTSRKAGMLVWAEAEGSMWQLAGDLTTWNEFSSGGGSLTPGGDLSGTSTSQVVSKIQGVPTPGSTSLPVAGAVLQAENNSTLLTGPRSVVSDGTFLYVGEWSQTESVPYVHKVLPLGVGSDGIPNLMLVGTIDLSATLVSASVIGDIAQDDTYLYCACWDTGNIAIIHKSTFSLSGWGWAGESNRRIVSVTADGVGNFYAFARPVDVDTSGYLYKWETASCLGTAPDTTAPTLSVTAHPARWLRYGFEKLWLTNGGYTNYAVLEGYNPATLTVESTLATIHAESTHYTLDTSASFSVACALGSIWLSDTQTNFLKLNPTSLSIQAWYHSSTGEIQKATFGEGLGPSQAPYLFVGSTQTNYIARVNPTTLEIVTFCPSEFQNGNESVAAIGDIVYFGGQGSAEVNGKITYLKGTISHGEAGSCNVITIKYGTGIKGDLGGTLPSPTVSGVRSMRVYDRGIPEIEESYVNYPVVNQPAKVDSSCVLQGSDEIAAKQVLSLFIFGMEGPNPTRIAILRNEDVVVISSTAGQAESRNVISLPTKIGDALAVTELITTVQMAAIGGIVWVLGYTGDVTKKYYLWQVDAINLTAKRYELDLYPCTSPDPAIPYEIDQANAITCTRSNNRVWVSFLDKNYLTGHKVIEINSTTGAIIGVVEPSQSIAITSMAGAFNVPMLYLGGLSGTSATILRCDLTSGYTWSDYTLPVAPENGTVSSIEWTLSYGSEYTWYANSLLILTKDTQDLGSGALTLLSWYLDQDQQPTWSFVDSIMIPAGSFPKFMGAEAVLSNEEVSILSDSESGHSFVLYDKPNPTLQLIRNTTKTIYISDSMVFGPSTQLAPNSNPVGCIGVHNGIFLLFRDSLALVNFTGQIGPIWPIGGSLKLAPYLHLAGVPIEPISQDYISKDGRAPVLRGMEFKMEFPLGAKLVNDGEPQYGSQVNPFEIPGTTRGTGVLKGYAQTKPTYLSQVSQDEFWVVLENARAVVNSKVYYPQSGNPYNVNRFFLCQRSLNSSIADVCYDSVTGNTFIVGSEENESKVWVIEPGGDSAVAFENLNSLMIPNGVQVHGGAVWATATDQANDRYLFYVDIQNPNVAGGYWSTANTPFYPSDAAMGSSSDRLWVAGYIDASGVLRPATLTATLDIHTYPYPGWKYEKFYLSTDTNRSDPALDVAVSPGGNVYFVSNTYLYCLVAGSTSQITETAVQNNPYRISVYAQSPGNYDLLRVLSNYNGEFFVSDYRYDFSSNTFTFLRSDILPATSAPMDVTMLGSSKAWVTFSAFDEVSAYASGVLGYRSGVGGFVTLGPADTLQGYPVEEPTPNKAGGVLTFNGKEVVWVNLASVREVTTTDTISNEDWYIGIGTVTGPITLYLPSSPITGEHHVIKDAEGLCQTYPVTLDGNGKNIDGAATFPINVAWMTTSVVYNGTRWSII